MISERIFEMLEVRGMSQKQFSDLTGIGASTISDWKHKGTNPSADKIIIICEVLDVSPYWLLSGVKKEPYVQVDRMVIDKESEEYHLVEEFYNLDRDSRKRLLGYASALSDLKKINLHEFEG